MNRLVGALATGLLGLAACSDPQPPAMGAPGTGPSEPITTIADLLRFQRERSCHITFQLLPGALEEARRLFGDEAGCATDPFWEGLSQTWGRFAELQRLESEGRLRVDPDGVSRCIALLGEIAGFSLTRYLDCAGMIVGTQELGAACTLNDECAGDAYCHFDGRVCPGRCAPRTGAGSTCTHGNPGCSGGRIGGSYCLLDGPAQGDADASGHCYEWVDELAAGEGAFCGTRRTAVQLVFVQCPVELFCDYDYASQVGMTTTSGTCRAPLAVGTPCNRSQHCEPGSVCAGELGAQTCQLRRWLAEGAPCVRATRVSAELCDLAAGLACGPSGCEHAAEGTAGSPCDALRPALHCAAGHRCDETGTCVELLPEGGACRLSTECQSGSCGPDQTCRARYCDADPY